MNRGLIVVIVTALLTIAAFAQKQTKPWKEWTRKEAEKILSDSAWSRTQTESESSGSSDVTTNFGDTRGREEAVRSNATNRGLAFHVRFFTARPVRQAYVRMLELGETPPDAAAAEKMDAWANLPADDRIIVTVSFEGDPRFVSRVGL